MKYTFWASVHTLCLSLWLTLNFTAKLKGYTCSSSKPYLDRLLLHFNNEVPGKGFQKWVRDTFLHWNLEKVPTVCFVGNCWYILVLHLYHIWTDSFCILKRFRLVGLLATQWAAVDCIHTVSKLFIGFLFHTEPTTTTTWKQYNKHGRFFWKPNIQSDKSIFGFPIMWINLKPEVNSLWMYSLHSSGWQLPLQRN